jgi:nicotinamide mononucleotide (NMN) deamidase PncC
MADDSLIREIHQSGWRTVIAATGGGATAIGDLLRVPGGSRSVLECVVPYSAAALCEWIGGKPDQFCSETTARAMAMAAFERARRLDMASGGHDPCKLVGIGCTASLASDRPKRGPHRVYVASQTAEATASCSLELTKGARTRREEERVCAALIVKALMEAVGVRNSH